LIWFVGSYALDVGMCAWGINKLSDDFRAVRRVKSNRPFPFAFSCPAL